MAIEVTTLETFSLGNMIGHLIKVKGDGTIKEIPTSVNRIATVFPVHNIDDSAAITDCVIHATDKSKFITHIDSSETAVADGKYRCFLVIGSR